MQKFTLDEIEILTGSVERDQDATRRKLVELDGNSRSATLDSTLRSSLKTEREKQAKLVEDLSILKAKLIILRREMLIEAEQEEAPTTLSESPSDN